MIINLTNREGHDILDGARAGIDLPEEIIDAALLATGDLAIQKSKYPEVLPMKTLLHIHEARCAGRGVKANPTICPQRDACGRHRQLEVDRKLGIDQALPNIKVYSLPYVRGQDCHFFIPA